MKTKKTKLIPVYIAAGYKPKMQQIKEKEKRTFKAIIERALDFYVSNVLNNSNYITNERKSNG